MADPANLSVSLDDLIQRSMGKKTGRQGNEHGASMAVDQRFGGVRKVQSQPRQPRETDENQSLIDQGVAAGEFIKVGGESATKGVAGKIAHSCRQGNPPAVLAKGPASINQAVKAIAVARSYLLEEGVDLTCQPAFRDDKQLASLALYLAKRAPVTFPTENVEALSSNKDSDPHKMAGAIAARVRDDIPVTITGIGVEAVSKCIRAICHGRLYLEQNGVDIKALVEFVHVQKGTETLNALCFKILVEKVGTPGLIDQVL